MPAIYRSTILGTQSGQAVQTIMGWYDSGFGPNVGRAGEVADGVRNAWVFQMMPYLVDDYSITGVDVICMDDPTIGASNLTPSEGSLTTDPAPLFVVGNVRLTTGRRGRSYQGRFGLPGLPLSVIDADNGNVWDEDQRGAYQTHVTTFIDGVESAGIHPQLAVVSTISGGTPREFPVATVVTTVELQAAFGSRISRKG